MALPITLELPEAMAEKVRDIAAHDHRTVAETVQLLAEEALKMREVPGVFFIDGPTGRRAKLWGGPDVWEVIETYLDLSKDGTRFRETYHFLHEDVLQTALTYYETYPEEINKRIALNRDAWR